MTKETMKAYTEIDGILSHMPKEYVLKVPTKLREKFKTQKDTTYQFEFSPGKHLRDCNLSKKTKSLLAMLKYNYWCKDEEEKNNLLLMFKQNEAKYQELLRGRYNVDNLFKNKTLYTSHINEDESKMAMTEYKESFISKIISKVKQVLKIFDIF